MTVKPLTEMTPDEIRIEISLLRDRRLTARQQAIEESKPKPRATTTTKRTTKKDEVGGGMGLMLDNLLNMDDSKLDNMLSQMEGL